ncbi:ABC transporter permease [Actinomadura sp. ATCC 31491]|uniref:ABC transporter permease n=1 Tax=Actinomadura luzonensis TaxID=2805427 RepID=A0ABT0FJC2_9ACTN|nr:ABC transporter permease [Actinomadura luzonensis]MCK2212409.1 ABC transporter permease [Actinomadura luzonensis]
MRTIRLVGVGGILAYRALFNWTSPSLFIGSLLAAPVFQLLFFVYLGREIGVADDNFYVLGNVLLAATGACVTGGTMAIANERRYGTLGPVLLSARSRMALWGGRALPYIGNALLVMVFTLVCASVTVGLRMPSSGVPGLLLALVAASLSGTAFGMVIGSIGLRARNTMVVANIAYTMLILLTGTNVARDTLPAWLGWIGTVLPLTHATEAVRASSDGAGLMVALGYVAQETAVGLGYGALAAALLKYFEWTSRRGASLDAL